MKEKILPFIIGLLVGAIIATGCFYVYTKNQESAMPANGFNGFDGERPEGGMHQGGKRREFTDEEMQNMMNGNGERPELPDGENGRPDFQDDESERPELPDGEMPKINDSENAEGDGSSKSSETKSKKTKTTKSTENTVESTSETSNTSEENI